MDAIEIKAMNEAIRESLWETACQEIEKEVKKNEIVLQVINGVQLEEKYQYCGEMKNKHVPYSIVHRRIVECNEKK
jgi:hypothetical protein